MQPSWLSRRVVRMLSRGERNPDATSREEIVRLLERAAIPAFEAAVEFELRYGGVRYPNGRLGLGSIVRGVRIAQGTWRVDCGQHRTRELWLDEDGRLFADDGIAIARSVEFLLERDAMFDDLLEERREWIWLESEVPSVAPKDLGRHAGFPKVDEASDDYEQWWSGDGARIRWFQSPGREPRHTRVWIFAATELLAEPLQSGIEREYGLTRVFVKSTWPRPPR